MGDDLGHRLRARMLTLLLRVLSATWRFRETIPPECAPVLDGRARGVVAFWHGKMLPVWYRFRGPRAGALVSMSRDGALLADYLERGLGYGEVIRGSSSRSGGEALREMVELLGERTCLITPDGPRGPLHRAKPGALIAASRAGVPLVLAGWECRRVTVLRSWDRMEIPHPFARIDIRYCIFDGNTTVTKTDAATGTGGTAVSNAEAAASAGDTAISGADAATGASGTVVSNAEAAASADDTAISGADAATGADDTGGPNADVATGSGDTAISKADAATGTDNFRDEQSQFDAVPGDTFAGARAVWIGPDVLERFDRTLDALNGPRLSAGGARGDAASSRGSRRI